MPGHKEKEDMREGEEGKRLAKPETLMPQGQKHIETGIAFSRVWAGPNCNTFDIPPIAGFVQKYLLASTVSIDPFARNKRWATYTNDLNPGTQAEFHLDAEEFVNQLAAKRVEADLVIFDPPYSPRQITECYQSIGKKTTMQDTQNCVLYSRVRAAIAPIVTRNGIVLSFGWNSSGMGKKFGFGIIEILDVCHGAAHNDTICIAEKRVACPQRELLPCGNRASSQETKSKPKTT